jgi:hypothetical protein
MDREEELAAALAALKLKGKDRVI